uniref:Metaxin-1-like n=1 Tax=Hirondellea gigas TaxID=1518452 RepID=A0A6A7FRH2_9CRUS
MPEMELHVWEGEPEWGIPSMDLESLQMMLYVKFAGAPVTIIKSAMPASAPSRSLPVFTCSEGNYTNFDSMTTFLRKQNYSCDHDLSGRQCADVLAYGNLLKDKLYPALLYLWWVEPNNYTNVIHNWFYSRMRFPFKLWVPSNKHKVATQFIEALYDEPDNTVALETELLKHAQECLTMVSHRLGEKDYFFGQSPTAVDALLIPYLTLLLKVDLKVPVLQNHVKACPNLTRYVLKTLQKFFPNESGGGSSSSSSSKSRSSSNRPHGNTNSSSSTTNQQASTADSDFPNKKRNIAICAVLAAVANVTYAVATGLVQMQGTSKENRYLHN